MDPDKKQDIADQIASLEVDIEHASKYVIYASEGLQKLKEMLKDL